MYEIKYDQQAREFRVYDDNGTRYGNGFLNEKHAQRFVDETLSQPSPELDLGIFNAVFGDEIRRSGDSQPTIETDSETQVFAPAEVEEKVIPVRRDRDEVTVSGKNEIGTIIDYRGESWLVTHCYEVTGNEPTHEEDEDQPAGWYSELFRVRNNAKAMEVVAEQYAAGQAQFTGPSTVKFPDEEHAHDLRDIAYSPASGLYDKTQA